MKRPNTRTVATSDGRRGTLQPQEDDSDRAVIRMEDGQQVVVPANLLAEQRDGSYYLPIALADNGERETDERLLVIPVLTEHLDVDKRRVNTGGVRIDKQVHQREVTVDEPGFEEEVHVERVAVQRILDEPAEIHYQDEALIIPIMEEVLVVEKRLMLKEELRVTKRRKEVRRPQRVTLRSERATVERLDPEGDSDHKPEE